MALVLLAQMEQSMPKVSLLKMRLASPKSNPMNPYNKIKEEYP